MWNYTHNFAQKHLQLENLQGIFNIDNLWSIPYDQSFWLDIRSFTNDICMSVFGANGYLAQLTTDPALQTKYADAINDLYDPTK